MVRQSCAESRAQVPGHAHMLHATAAVARNLLNAFKQTDENCDTGQQSVSCHLQVPPSERTVALLRKQQAPGWAVLTKGRWLGSLVG